VVAETPNFFGVLEEMGDMAEAAHRSGALMVAGVDPISLGLLAPPGDYGADIAVGEGQTLGSRPSYGGPCLGFIATRKEYIRRLPGRIVGRTTDAAGAECFCLTLQTREQHIRREKATSNICTNQALMALRAAVYLCWLGKQGIRDLAGQCLSKAVYARKRLEAAGFYPTFDRPFFREFAFRVGADAGDVVRRVAERKMLAGVPLGTFFAGLEDSLLVAFTEKRTRLEIDYLVESVQDAVREVGAAS
jgi:glycine dehydrogenase subunit 1